MIFYIIIFIILLFLSKLDELDRKSVYYYFKNNFKMKTEYPLKAYLKIFYKTLLIPFKEKKFFQNIQKVVCITVMYLNFILNLL